jgi:hypothetical protein
LNYLLCIVLIRSVPPATDLYVHLAMALVASPFLELNILKTAPGSK